MNGSQLLSVVLTQVEEQYAPPSMPVLDVTVIDGVAYLSIAEWSESADGYTVKTLAQVAVECADVVNALTMARVTECWQDWRRVREESRAGGPVEGDTP